MLCVCTFLWPLTSASKQCKHDNSETFLCLYVYIYIYIFLCIQVQSVLPSHALYQWSTTFLNLRSLTSVLVKGKIYLWKCWEKITWNAFHFSKCQENTNYPIKQAIAVLPQEFYIIGLHLILTFTISFQHKNKDMWTVFHLYEEIILFRQERGKMQWADHMKCHW